jgi:putative ABC transport system substrate-binding protein
MNGLIMRILFSAILVLLITSLFSCTDQNNIVNNGYKRNFVLIGDMDAGSDMVLLISGEIRKHYGDVDVIYIQSKKFDVAEASYILESAYNSYPNDTYFCAVVDPGSTSDRIYLESEGRKIIVPNNGIATRILKHHQTANVRFIDNISIFTGYDNLKSVPYETFYNKSVLKMLNNDTPASFGSECKTPLQLADIEPSSDGVTVKGQILYVDNFGNCVSNINDKLSSIFKTGDYILLKTAGKKIYLKYGDDYSSVGLHQNVSILNSSKRIEFAVNFSDFSQRYGINSGDSIEISKAVLKIGFLRLNNSTISKSIMDKAKARLSEFGLIEGVNVNYIERNAESDITKYPALITDLLSNTLNIIIPISTSASQAVIKYVPDSVPVVYTYVTSPEFAGILNKRLHVTGLSDATNFDDYLKFAKELFPDLITAGRIYNPSEPNSAFAQDQFNSLNQFYNVNYENETVSSVESIGTAYQNLRNKNIKYFLIAADNTLNLGMKQLTALTNNDKTYVLGDSRENVKEGALAAIAVDYDELSEATGDYILSVLLGIEPDTMPLKKFHTSDVSINQKTAAAIGYQFPESVLNKAAFIVK